jgi:hypothetical protein
MRRPAARVTAAIAPAAAATPRGEADELTSADSPRRRIGGSAIEQRAGPGVARRPREVRRLQREAPQFLDPWRVGAEEWPGHRPQDHAGHGRRGEERSHARQRAPPRGVFCREQPCDLHQQDQHYDDGRVPRHQGLHAGDRHRDAEVPRLPGPPPPVQPQRRQREAGEHGQVDEPHVLVATWA